MRISRYAITLTCRIAILVFLSAWAVSAQEESSSTEALELERTQALIEAGALPRSALAGAQRELERGRLKQRLRETLLKKDLTLSELPGMLAAASGLRDLAREGLRETTTRVDAGALPVKALEPVKQDYEFARKQYELAETRARLVREMAEMARAEERLDELYAEEMAFSSDGSSALGGIWEEDLEALAVLFYETFGTDLPLSAEGDTALHRSMGFDHSGRYDVAVSPDDVEGRFIIDVLESWGLPYIAFRSAVPGQATGPHIHIGTRSDAYRPDDDVESGDSF